MEGGIRTNSSTKRRLHAWGGVASRRRCSLHTMRLEWTSERMALDTSTSWSTWRVDNGRTVKRYTLGILEWRR
eukprot:2373975-Amphidinium_carterae.1